MEKIFREEALTFDDVLIVPGYSRLVPFQVDTSAFLTKKIGLNIPLLSAPMDTLTEVQMAISIAKEGGLGVIHRNLSVEEQASQVSLVKNYAVDKNSFKSACVDSQGKLLVGAAVGVNDFDRVKALLSAGVDLIVIDTAHGHSLNVIEATKKIKQEFPEAQVIAGNVCTKEGAEALIEAGADAVKTGMGSGSICSTRIVSGAGMPQLSAVIACADAGKAYGVPIISDGGTKSSGDIVKALAAGASAVMLGNLLAGTEEAPGKEVVLRGKKYKQYNGMGSLSAMAERQGILDRYGLQGSNKIVPEGVEGLVEFKGSVAQVIVQLVGGLRSGMGYAGAANIKELHEKTRFTRISRASFIEGHPHDIVLEESKQ